MTLSAFGIWIHVDETGKEAAEHEQTKTGSWNPEYLAVWISRKPDKVGVWISNKSQSLPFTQLLCASPQKRHCSLHKKCQIIKEDIVKEKKIALSSPLAESARAFTGRRNSHSGRGEDFLSRQLIFFTETAVTPERKVEKWFPRWEINRHAEG